LTAIYPRFTHESGTIRKKQAIDLSNQKRLLCYESQHQSQSNEKSLVQFDYEEAVSNYLGAQSIFNPLTPFIVSTGGFKRRGGSVQAHHSRQDQKSDADAFLPPRSA